MRTSVRPTSSVTSPRWSTIGVSTSRSGSSTPHWPPVCSARLDRVRWAHQSYAEYLAARYLVRHGMPSKQVVPLIQSAGDPEGKLVPQLHGLAGWLYGM